MRTKPAKGGHFAPGAISNVLKCAPGGGAPQKGLFISQKGLRCTGGPDLLKWGVPGGGINQSNLLKSRRPLMSTTPPCLGDYGVWRDGQLDGYPIPSPQRRERACAAPLQQPSSCAPSSRVRVEYEE